MLLLLFEIGDGRYALNAEQIVSVVPLVKLKKIPLMPDYVAGLMNYRGEAIPVIDLGQLVTGTPSAARFSTRIILIKYETATGQKEKKLGLIASQVTETVKTKLLTPPSSGVLMDENLYPDGIESESEGMIQWFDLKRILPDRKIDVLFQE